MTYIVVCSPFTSGGINTNLMKVKMKVNSLSHVQLFATPWTIQSLEFSRPEYWKGQLFPSPGDLPNLGHRTQVFRIAQILY